MDPRYVDRHPYFEGKILPSAQSLFVCWVDAMGIESAMRSSLTRTANFVFKLHIAALEAPRSLRLYPVMDGLYIVARQASDIRIFIADVFSRLADMFVCESEPKHRFVVRAGVAHGQVVHGDSLPSGISDTLDLNTRQRDSIILGEAIIDAFSAEHSAPPFGVAVQDSVVGLDTVDIDGVPTWAWFTGTWDALAADLRGGLDDYFDWCSKNPGDPAYTAEDIERHRKASRAYFPGAV